MKTVDEMKEYLYYFAHPALCHNRVHLARQENVLQHQSQLISAQQTFLHTLYTDLGSNFGLVNQQIAELVKNQMSAVAYTEGMEQSLCQYIPHMVQEVLAHQGLDSNWISVVTNHVQGTKEVIKTLIHEMEQINLAITSSPNNQVAAAEDAKMLHKDVLELFDHYHNIERDQGNPFGQHTDVWRPEDFPRPTEG